jgi:hypothetical protein
MLYHALAISFAEDALDWLECLLPIAVDDLLREIVQLADWVTACYQSMVRSWALSLVPQYWF